MEIAKPCIECKDCKYWDSDLDFKWDPLYYDGDKAYCIMIDSVTDEHFYCKYGEFIDEVIMKGV